MSMDSINEDALYRLYTYIDLLWTLAQIIFAQVFRSDNSCFSFDLLHSLKGLVLSLRY